MIVDEFSELENSLENFEKPASCKKIISFIREYIDYKKYPTIPSQLKFAFENRDNLYERLERIAQTGDTARDKVPEDVQTWEQFCETNPSWKSPESYVCFRDDPLYHNKFVLKQRVQHSALCYIHAPSVLLYYLYKRNHPEFNELIDISHYIRNNFNNDLLYKHLFGDIGGDSLDLLRHLTKHKVAIKVSNIEDVNREKLQKYGPMLAHSFLVYEDLIHSEISTHDQKTFTSELTGSDSVRPSHFFTNSRQFSVSKIFVSDNNINDLTSIKDVKENNTNNYDNKFIGNNNEDIVNCNTNDNIKDENKNKDENENNNISIKNKDENKYTNNNLNDDEVININNFKNIFSDARGFSTSLEGAFSEERYLSPRNSRANSPRVPDKKHALLLVGIRHDSNTNSDYFLFQNWWKGKQFFEANIWYLDKCEVLINYVRDEINEFLKTDLICGEYFETCCDFSCQNLSEIYAPGH
jgi:hypothetical protein